MPVSTSTTATSPLPVAGLEPCASCGAPLAPDQRYCLECGTRRVVARSGYLDNARPAAGAPPAGALAPEPVAPLPPPPLGPPGRNANAVIAGVGVLLLAMGVGILIGRSGGSSVKTVAAPAPQVISVGGTAPAGAAFTDDWPAGTDGWTVQLQTLPEATTQPPAVAAAKSAATAKGAGSVGALKSDDYSNLTPGSYIVYSGVYTSRAQAQRALKGVAAKFPGASVIEVNGSGGSAASSSSSSGSSGSSGSSSGGSAKPPAAITQLRSTGSGKSFEQKSKSLPKQLGTGGAPPPTDTQAPGGGSGGGVSIG